MTKPSRLKSRLIDWKYMPAWPLYVAFYVVIGFVVGQSFAQETARQCEASSPVTKRGRLVCGAIWPITAASMINSQMDPLASLHPRK